MSRQQRIMVLLAGAALLAASAAACDRSREVEASSPPASPPAAGLSPASPPVPAAPVSSAPQPRFVEAVAGEPIPLVLGSHLMVERDVGVTTRRDGVVESIRADRGERVTEGQTLAALEHGDLVLSEQTAELELQKEQASFERAERLREQSIVSQEEFEQARLRRDAAQKALERIRYELEKSFIRAPFDGVISGRFVEKGQVIKEDDRRVLFQVTAMKPLLARLYVPEWALFGLREGQRAWVTPAAAPPVSGAGAAPGIEARVRWINVVLDPASATTEVLVEVPEGAGLDGLRPGMSVQVRLELAFGGKGSPSGSDMVSLPREAIGAAEPAAGQRVELHVMSRDGSVQPRSVILGFVGDRRVEVRQGLSAGEKVLLGPEAP